MKKEHRSEVEQFEEKLKTSKVELDKVTGEKRSNEAKIAEMQKIHATEMKEKSRLSESEIAHVRANWADAERKVRTVTDEKLKIEAELDRSKASV